MARITFNPDQPIQSLSGSIGSMTFRTVHGKTHVYRRTDPVLPKRPTPLQRERFRHQCIMNNCMQILQGQYRNIQEALQMRGTIKKRLEQLYRHYAPEVKAPTKLQKAMMTDYYQQYGTVNGSILEGQTPDNGPTISQNEKR